MKFAGHKLPLRVLLKLYNIDHDQIYLTSNTMLGSNPHNHAEMIDYPNFKYNGYYWTIIRNVIIVYSIHEKHHSVRIRACYSALSGFALKIFFGEYDPDYNN